MELVKTGKLSSKELEIVRKECDIYHYKDRSYEAGVYTQNAKHSINHNIRSGKVYFPKINESPKIRQILQSVFLENYYYLDVNLTDISSIQYTYYSKGNRFLWHRDPVLVPGVKKNIRILTMSLNISDPGSYTGGQLLVKHNKTELELSKEPGSYITFPSFLQHKAGEVESGEREAIVMWLQSSRKDLEKLKEYYNLHYTFE